MNEKQEHDCTIDGVTFGIRDDFEHGIIDETWVERVYGDTIMAGERVIDIGANIGAFSLWAAKKGAFVEAFEPSEENYRRLGENIARNDFSRSIRAHKKAVWSEKGEIRLFHHPWNIGGHSVVKDKDSGYEAVESVTLAEVIGDRGVDFIKMDCEGAEFEIIMATPDEALAKVRRIAMEFHYRDGAHASEVERMRIFREKLLKHFDIEMRENKWDHGLPYIICTKRI